MLSHRLNNRNMIIWLILFGIFGAAVYVLRSVLLPFVAGIIIGYLLDPWTSKIEKLGISRTFASLLVMFLMILLCIHYCLRIFLIRFLIFRRLLLLIFLPFYQLPFYYSIFLK